MANPTPARQRRRSTRSRRALTAGTVLLLATALPWALTTHPHATAAPHHTPSATRLPESPTPDDGALALPHGATLAPPKILDLDPGTTTLALRQLIEDHPGKRTRHDASLVPSATASAGPPAGQPGTASPAPTHSASPSAPADTATPSSAPTAAPTPADPAFHRPALRPLLGLGALLAAGLTALLALRHIRRLRHTPGAPPAPHPAPAGGAAPAKDGADLARLDAALRTLAHHGHALGPLRAARITATSLQVLPHDRRKPVPPFTTGPHHWWTLPQDAVLLDSPTASTIPPPCPGLVTLGTTSDGAQLLIDLSQQPALLLDGSPDHITAVCTTLALEAALSPWADDTEIWTIAFGDDLPRLLPARPITHLPHAGQALRELNARLLEIHQQPADAREPVLLLFAPTLSTDAATQLPDIIRTARRARITLIGPARTLADHFPDAETLNASATNPQPVSGTHTNITLQRLTPTDYQHLTRTLTNTPHPPTTQPPLHTTHPQPQPEQPDPRQPQQTSQQQDLSRPQAPGRRDTPGRQGEPDQREAPDRQDTPHQQGEAARQDTPGRQGEAGQARAPHSPHGPGRHGGPQQPDPSAHGTTPATARPAPPTDDGTIYPALIAATKAPPQALSPNISRPATAPAPPVQPRTTPPATGTRPASTDLRAPQLRVLGPVEMDRVPSTGHGPRQAQLAALLYFRPGRSAETLCADMDPDHPWTKDTLNARLQGLRRNLGHDPDGHPYVPRRHHPDAPYQLSPHVHCDFDHFRSLTDHAQTLGPAGLPHLQQALALVRGRPFGDKPPPWAAPLQQEMTTRIIDVTHTIATYRTEPGPHHNLIAARQAVATGHDVDDTSELLYRDWMRIEHAANNRAGLHTAISRLQQVNRALDCSLEPETEQLIHQLLSNTHSA